MRAEHDQGHALLHCRLQNALEGLAHEHTQLHSMVGDLGWEKRLESRVGLLPQINDHRCCCDLGWWHRWRALGLQGTEERQVVLPQTLIDGLRCRLVRDDVHHDKGRSTAVSN